MGDEDQRAGRCGDRRRQKKLADDPLFAFEHRLAKSLGMTRDRLLEEMPAAEFSGWLAMQSVDPLFDPWLANAMQCAAIANAFGGSAKPSQFMPVRPKRPSSPATLKAYMKARVKRGTD